MQKIRYIVFLVFLLGDISCINRESEERFKIPSNMVLMNPDNSEILLTDFILQNEKTFIVYINAECTSCLLTLTWWLDFFEQYPALKPLVIFKTNNFQFIELFFDNLFPIKYPVLLDENAALWETNYLNKDLNDFIWITREGSILLKGNMDNKKDLDRFRSEYTKNY